MTEKQSLPPSQQWQTLHNNYETYEKYALVIKLITITLTVLSISLAANIMLALCIIIVLWFQEAIWKTYQSRLSNAIIKLEQENFEAYQLYSHWQDNRPNTTKLINEYIGCALKPTVAFPYVPLIVITLIFH